MLLKPAIALVAFLCVYVKGETCPPESLTRPCECLPEVELTLECRKITDASDLDGVSRRTGDVTFNKFRLFNSSMDAIPSSILKQKQFEAIEIYDSRLYSLFDAAAEETNKLKFLDMLHVEFGHTFPWSEFEYLEELVGFRAIRTFIPEIDNGFIDNVSKKLIYFILSETNTRYISDGAFSEHGDLTEVVIQKCGLKSISRSYFARPAAEIFSLNFDGNSIHDVPEDMFSEMPKLAVVSLRGNKLKTISDKVWKLVGHQMTLIRLEDNPLICDCNLKWVVTLHPEYSVSGKCESGFEELKDKQLETLKPEDFQSCQ